MLDLSTQIPAGNRAVETSRWIYALVAPFPTVPDGVGFQDLQDAWHGKVEGQFSGRPILVDPITRAVFERLWGPPAPGAVQVIEGQETLLDAAWKDRPAWAIVPFEDLEPRWKVLRIDGQSPLDKDFRAEEYPLAVSFQIAGPDQAASRLSAMTGSGASLMTATNRDPSRLTVLVMTGVTALVRATAWKMDTLGVLYPGRDIREWLINADVTHISNEVSFDPGCPPGDPRTASMRFCSRPEYIDLLEDVGADVIELSGNHMNDWGHTAFLYTLDMYRQHGLKFFAGGENQESARQPLLVEHNGNRIAFIGCNPAGPPADWATETTPGSAACDLDWMAGEISRLRQQGYLPIATFQYMESYQFVPGPGQQRDFRKMADAGAVIVSGSQAHFPQTFEFGPANLIHYGLGNLFFDQIGPIINDVRIYGTEREFVDRHIFYDGRYISTELLTAMLEDYARPRPMTAERAEVPAGRCIPGKRLVRFIEQTQES